VILASCVLLIEASLVVVVVRRSRLGSPLAPVTSLVLALASRPDWAHHEFVTILTAADR
jgi:hypothetical protein